VNGRVSRKLRQIAKELKLEPKTEYAPGGRLRRRANYVDDKGVLQPGAPIPRPFVLRECFRRAYQEAKKIYKGEPPSICVPEAKEKEEEVPFRARVAQSLRTYHNV
jgi:hypothetical protein